MLSLCLATSPSSSIMRCIVVDVCINVDYMQSSPPSIARVHYYCSNHICSNLVYQSINQPMTRSSCRRRCASYAVLISWAFFLSLGNKLLSDKCVCFAALLIIMLLLVITPTIRYVLPIYQRYFATREIRVWTRLQ